MAKLRLAPNKPRVEPRPDFEAFKATAFPISIGSNLKEIDAIKAQKSYITARHHDTILFTIDSNGGHLEYVGLIIEVIYDLMDSGIDVRVIAEDKRYSIAMSIFISFPPAARYCGPQTKFMIHSVHFGANQPELTPEGREFVADRNRLYILDPVVAGTRIARESLQAVLDSGEDLFIPASEALQLRIVSAIIK
ncbi:MAG: hypothetical protein NVSMB39_4410 [Candidatus Saccharimonadales bacterium]